MTLGVQTACLEQYPLEEVLDFLQKTGIGQVELISGHLMYKTPAYCEDVAAEVHERGMTISGYVWDGNGAIPWFQGRRFRAMEPGGVQDAIECIRQNVVVTAALGGSHLVVIEPRGPEEGLNEPAAWQQLVTAYREGAAIAAEAGVRLVNEFHPPGDFASTPERAIALIDEVDSPNFTACLDFCHAEVMAPGDAEGFIRRLGVERIGHIHIAGGDSHPHMHRAVGTGEVDAIRLLAVLRRIGYDANYSLCLYGNPLPRRAIRQSVDYLRANGYFVA